MYTSMTEHFQELYSGYVFLDFVPTSENICRYLHTIIQEKMRELDVVVSKVQFFETVKSQCTFKI